MRIHIDGDILVYRCGFAAEKGEYILSYTGKNGDEIDEAYTYKKDLDARCCNLGLPDGAYSIHFSRRPEPVENALYNVRSMVERTIEDLGSDDIVIYLSGEGNFRNEIATIKKYKGNRDPAQKPVHGPAIKEYIKSKWPTVVSAGEEADDVIGYSHYKLFTSDPYSSVVASTDKDLDMIPGLHYNFVKQESYFVDEEEALRRFYTQILTGDSTDNIQGVPGIGPKKAAALLEDCTGQVDMYQVVREAFGDDDAMLETARLIWIRRNPEELWSPPTGEEIVHS